MTGIEYVVEQLGRALQEAERRIAWLESVVAGIGSEPTMTDPQHEPGDERPC